MKRAYAIAFLLLAGCGDPAPEPVLSLAIHAAPDALESENGTTPSAVLRAFLVEDDVPTRVEPTRWILLDPSFGAIDEEGRFIANGRRGGVARVRAELEHDGETLSAETEIAIRVRRDFVVTPGLSPAIVSSFEAATPVDDPRSAPFVRYPLEGARVPNDIAPLSIQWDDDWDSGGAQDPIRVTLESPHAVVRAYLDGTRIDGAWTVDDASWSLLAQAAAGETIEVEVARLGMHGTVAPSGRVRFSMSTRALHLSMVAWELSIDPQRSRLVELDPSTNGASELVDLGATECTGCHTVAIDDDQLAATVDRLFTGVWDASGNELARIEPPLDAVAFQPGGSLLIGSRTIDGASALFAFDRTSGDAIAMDTLPSNAGFASWSRDGRFLAFAAGGSDAPSGTSGPTSIAVTQLDGDAFGTPASIHDGSELADAPEGGETDSHPSFSPDGAWIAFAHGTSSHAVLEGSTSAQSALYLVRATGGEPVRLDAAMGIEGDSIAFWPVFAPRATIEEDGTRLFWLAFYSRMPYGNDRAGTRGSAQRQLWVAAIDPTREGDPSYPPFRVAAQRIDRDQLGGAWRVASCVAEEGACRTDSQCCSGSCVDGTCGPALACRPLGATCDEASPCCGELVCDASQCVEVIE